MVIEFFYSITLNEMVQIKYVWMTRCYTEISNARTEIKLNQPNINVCSRFLVVTL